MSDEIAARLRALLPVASSIDRLLISVTDLRALLDELARLRDLFRLDGEQHANHIKELTKAHEARITKYADELARLRAPVEGEAGEMVQWLSALNHISLEDCFLQSPMFAKAADLITRQAASLRAAREVMRNIDAIACTSAGPGYSAILSHIEAWLAKHHGDKP